MSPRKSTSLGPATAVAESTVPVVVAVVAGAVVENTEAKVPNRLCPKCGRPLSEDPPADLEHDYHDSCHLEIQQEKNAELLEQVPKLRAMVVGRLSKALERFAACFNFKSSDRAKWPEEVAQAIAEAEEELRLGDADAQRACKEGTPGAFAPAKHHFFRASDAITKAFYFRQKRVAEEVLAQLTPNVAKDPNAKFRAAMVAFRAACVEENGWKKSAAIREAERLMIEAMEAAITARKQLRGELQRGAEIGADPKNAAALLQVARAGLAEGEGNEAVASPPPGKPQPRRLQQKKVRRRGEGESDDGEPKRCTLNHRTRLSEGEGDEE